MINLFSVSTSDESVTDGSEPLGPDLLMEAVLYERKSGACDLGEGAECPSGSKQNDKCCYLKAGKKMQGVCKSTSYLQVVQSTGYSVAGVFFACLAKGVTRTLEPEPMEWDDGGNNVTIRATNKDCVTHEGINCPPGLKENDKCCYYAGGKKKPGICSTAASIEVLTDGSFSQAAIVLGCFAKSIAK